MFKELIVKSIIVYNWGKCGVVAHKVLEYVSKNLKNWEKGVGLMPEVLQDLPGRALSKVIETNLYAFLPFSHNWPQAEVHTGLDISWCITDIPFPSCNSVFRAQLNPDHIDSTIESLSPEARPEMCLSNGG